MRNHDEARSKVPDRLVPLIAVAVLGLVLLLVWTPWGVGEIPSEDSRDDGSAPTADPMTAVQRGVVVPEVAHLPDAGTATPLVVSGTVRGGLTGEPIEGATVVVRSTQAQLGGEDSGVVAELGTRGDGSFEVQVERSTRHDIEITSESYVPTIRHAFPGSPVDILLRPGIAIQVMVLEEETEIPVPGASCRVLASDRLGGEVNQIQLTNRDGMAKFRVPDRDYFRVLVNPEGRPTTQARYFALEEAGVYKITVEPSAFVHGFVRDSYTAAPLGAVSIRPFGSDYFQTVSAEDGSFELSVRASGGPLLWVFQRHGYLEQIVRLTDIAEVGLVKGSSIVGTVEPAGKGIQVHAATMEPRLGTNRWESRVGASDMGVFEVLDVPPDERMLLAVLARDRVIHWSTVVSRHAGETLEVGTLAVEPPAIAKVMVRTEATQDIPVSVFCKISTGLVDPNHDVTLFHGSMLVPEDGQVVFDGLPHGHASLRLLVFGSETWPEQFELIPGEERSVELDIGGVVAGTVASAAGDLLAGRQVGVTTEAPTGENRVYTRFARSDSQGQFVAIGLDAGTSYRVEYQGKALGSVGGEEASPAQYDGVSLGNTSLSFVVTEHPLVIRGFVLNTKPEIYPNEQLSVYARNSAGTLFTSPVRERGQFEVPTGRYEEYVLVLMVLDNEGIATPVEESEPEEGVFPGGNVMLRVR